MTLDPRQLGAIEDLMQSEAGIHHRDRDANNTHGRGRECAEMTAVSRSTVEGTDRGTVSLVEVRLDEKISRTSPTSGPRAVNGPVRDERLSFEAELARRGKAAGEGDLVFSAPSGRHLKRARTRVRR